MDLALFRPHFPMVERMLFLNHASEAPVSGPVRARIEQYLDIASGDPDSAPIDMDPVRELLARLFGGSRDEYALMPNTATAIGIVAGGLAFAPGDNVVIPAEEYPANSYPWLTLRPRGVEVRIAPLGPGGRVDPERLAGLVDDRTRVVSVSAVEYLSGFRHDLKALSRIAHSVGALFVVDGIQACGAVPLNVDDDGIDVLAAGGYKWLLGPIGTGFAYYRRSVWERITPLLPGARSSTGGSEDARGEFALLNTAGRYETGCLPFSLIHGWTAGLEMLLEAGIPQIHTHLLSLTDRLIAGLQERGLTVLSPVEQEAERSGIVVCTTGSPQGNEGLVKQLATKGIIIAYRGKCCRISPAFYNTEADIDHLLEALV